MQTNNVIGMALLCNTNLISSMCSAIVSNILLNNLETNIAQYKIQSIGAALLNVTITIQMKSIILFIIV